MSFLYKSAVVVVLLSVSMWYFHEYHTTSFIKISRSIPYLNTAMKDLHNFLRGPTNKTENNSQDKLYTVEELSLFSGASGSLGLYLSILGKVYDVSKGQKHYGPDGGYRIFAGRDASRAFVTGEFTELGATDHVLDLSARELLSLAEWAEFYDKEYIYKGKLIGRFYDAKGNKTGYLLAVETKIDSGKEEKVSEYEEKLQFPPCNAEWSHDKGSRVWCTKMSGGIERNWSGVPRKYFEVGSDKFRCACINLKELKNPASPVYAKKGQFKLYEGCGPKATSCVTR